jgi:tRNA pseudouridine38-40 synthase
MTRYFIQLSFDGTSFHGWQIQKNAHSVQDEIQQALSTILRTSIEVYGAGRTDAQVHAKMMVAHFEHSESIEELDKLEYKVNSLLPNSIAIQQIVEVPNDLHARFSATARSYEYHLHQIKNPFKLDRSYYLNQELDIEKMNEAAKILFEYEDFSCFSKSHTQTFTNNCDIKVAYWEKTEDGLIFHITANRFLRNMVRAIVGTLLEIGSGKLELKALHHIIQSKNRSLAGTSVPACGLYLSCVEYPIQPFN